MFQALLIVLLVAVLYWWRPKWFEPAAVLIDKVFSLFEQYREREFGQRGIAHEQYREREFGQRGISYEPYREREFEQRGISHTEKYSEDVDLKYPWVDEAPKC